MGGIGCLFRFAVAQLARKSLKAGRAIGIFMATVPLLPRGASVHALPAL